MLQVFELIKAGCDISLKTSAVSNRILSPGSGRNSCSSCSRRVAVQSFPPFPNATAQDLRDAAVRQNHYEWKVLFLTCLGLCLLLVPAASASSSLLLCVCSGSRCCGGLVPMPLPPRSAHTAPCCLSQLPLRPHIRAVVVFACLYRRPMRRSSRRRSRMPPPRLSSCASDTLRKVQACSLLLRRSSLRSDALCSCARRLAVIMIRHSPIRGFLLCVTGCVRACSRQEGGCRRQGDEAGHR